MLATVPKSTIGAPPVTRFVPWMVTVLPAKGTWGPDAGVTEVTVGALVGA